MSEASPPPAVQLDQFLGELATHLTRGGLPCSGIWPTARGDLHLQLFSGRLPLLWKTSAALPGELSLLGRSIVGPPGAAPLLLRRTVEQFTKILSGTAGALHVLDRRNREISSVPRSAQDLLRLIANALVVGEPAWGPWRLQSVHNQKEDGHDRFCLQFEADGRRVVLALLLDSDDPAVTCAWLKTPLGAVTTWHDDRTEQERGSLEHQVERLLAYQLAMGLHPGMSWVEPAPTRQIGKLLVIAGLPETTALRCTKAWTMAERLGSGRLLPCCSRFLKQEVRDVCESPSNGSFLAAWNSEGMQRIRRAWAASRPYETCERDCMRFHGGLEEDSWIFEPPTSKSVYDNAVKALREMAAGAEVLESLPQRVMLSVSDRCNIRCVMCSTVARPEGSPGAEGSTLGQAECEEVMSLFPVLRLLSVSGGEPLLDPRTLDLVGQFDAERFPDGHVHMVTNGLLLTDAATRRMRRTRLSLTVSINAASPETYEFITGVPGGYERVLRNIRGVLQAAPEFAVQPRVVLSYVVMKSNYRELPEFLRVAHSLNAGIRLLPVFGELGGQSVFTDEPLLRQVTEYLEQRVLPETRGYSPEYGHMVEHIIRVQRARLAARDFRPY